MEAPMQLWLNWLWQGTAVTALVVCAVRARALNAATRERVWWITLIVVAGMPVLQLLQDASEGSVPVTPLGPPASALTVRVPATAGAILALSWASWILLSLIRLAVAFAQLRQARRMAVPFDRDREARLPNWAALRGAGRPARLVVSEHVHRAAVLGWTRPMIAIAPDILERLTDEEIDQVILHEHAHVQRRDDLALVAQRLVTSFAGLHPAVWWLDRAVTREREAVCDDWVVAHTGAPRRYASCLIQLSASARPDRWNLAPGAAASRSELTLRVTRLLDRRRNGNTARSRTALWLAQAGVMSLALGTAAMPLVAVAGLESEAAAEPTPIRAIVRTTSAEPSPMAAASTNLPSSAVIAHPRLLPRQPTQPALSRQPDAATSENRPAPRASVGVSSLAEEPQTSVELLAQPQQAHDLLPATTHPTVLSMFEAPRDRSRGATEVDDPIWVQVSAAGTAIGRRSQAAAVGTASFFTRFGKSVAGAF